MEYLTLNAERASIAIMRVENGWLIRTNNSGLMLETPLKVAETPDALVGIIREWAQSQEPKLQPKGFGDVPPGGFMQADLSQIGR